MTIIQAIILGIVQGLTEFLPISSSAHLVIVPFIAGWKLDQNLAFVFDVLVQLGTLLAVIFYFRKDILEIIRAWIEGIKKKNIFGTENSRMGWYLIFATIPAGIVGLFLKSKVEAAFASPVLTAVFLFITAILITISDLYARHAEAKSQQHGLVQMSVKDSLVIGLFQALSVFPGISRSGSTISGGLLCRFDRRNAARFAFLMAIPVMLAAGVLGVRDMIELPNFGSMALVIAIGFILAAIVGYFVIRWFLNYLRGKSMLPFALYCAVLAILVVVIAYFRA